MRQIFLDTETTGLEPDMGHKIIEIGAVECVDRKLTGRHFHKYINPQRAIDDGAKEVHGITEAFLADKPVFAEVWNEFREFVEGAEVIIHNAPFDVSFIEYEVADLARDRNDTSLRKLRLGQVCQITDSLALARDKHPGQRASLDALCRRYEVDNSQRQLHGALLDAEILADVYLAMTGGQTALFGGGECAATASHESENAQRLDAAMTQELRVVGVSDSEAAAHAAFLDLVAKKSGAEPIWRQVLPDA